MVETMSRSVIVDTNEGPILVEGIPDDAKITYGPMTPGSKSYQGNERTLRIYTSQTNQLAVFVGVTSFRDLSLTISRRQVTNSGETTSVQGPDGKFYQATADETYEWVQESNPYGDKD